MYLGLDDRMRAIQEQIQLTRRPISIHNCTPITRLSAFPYLPFEEAVSRATFECEKKVDPAGWYTSWKHRKANQR